MSPTAEPTQDSPRLARGRAFVARHKGAVPAVIAIGIIATVAAIPLASTVSRAIADSEFLEAKRAALAQYRTDATAQADFKKAHAAVAELAEQVQRIDDQATAGEYLRPEQLSALKVETRRLSMYAGFKAGKPVRDPLQFGPRREGGLYDHTVNGQPATASITVDALQAETARLRAVVADQTPSHETTVKGAAGIAAQTTSTNKVLRSIITGAREAKGVAAVPALDVVAAGVLEALPSAEQPIKDALTANASTALKSVKAATSPAELLLAYLEQAAAVRTSHDAATAPAPETPAQPDGSVGGVTDTGPGSGGGAGGAQGNGGGQGRTSTPGTGDAPAAPAPAAPAPAPEPAPAPVDQARHIVPGGAYTPGCNGGDRSRIGSHDPGPGGTSTPSYSFPWDYSGGGTGGYTFYACI